MARMGLKAALTQDREHVVVELEKGDATIGHILLDAPTADDVIARLGANRAAMLKQVPESLDPGSRLYPVGSPGWLVPDTLGPENSVVLALRHPGLGWLSFLLEPDRAAEIAQALLAQLTPRPPEEPPA